jgi:hypothetical protein
MFELGKWLLLFLAGVEVLGTPFADLNRLHVYNESWPPHARFHCAAYTLMNVVAGLVAILLLLTMEARDHRSIALAAALLVGSGLSFFGALLFRGTSALASPTERVIRGQPISLWMTGLHMALTVLGAGLAWN